MMSNKKKVVPFRKVLQPEVTKTSMFSISTLLDGLLVDSRSSKNRTSLILRQYPFLSPGVGGGYLKTLQS